MLVTVVLFRRLAEPRPQVRRAGADARDPRRPRGSAMRAPSRQGPRSPRSCRVSLPYAVGCWSWSRSCWRRRPGSSPYPRSVASTSSTTPTGRPESPPDSGTSTRRRPGGGGCWSGCPRILCDAAAGQCAALPYIGSDNCYPVEIAHGRALIATSAGSYNPLFYWVLGTVAKPFHGVSALYAMRIFVALMSAAAAGPWGRRSSPWRVLGGG